MPKFLHVKGNCTHDHARRQLLLQNKTLQPRLTIIIIIGNPLLPNGLRYLRWGGDGEAVQPEKGLGVGNYLGCAQNPQRQGHALLGAFCMKNLLLSISW